MKDNLTTFSGNAPGNRLVQNKSSIDNNSLKHNNPDTAQSKGTTTQLQSNAGNTASNKAPTPKENKTGLPDNLKEGVENLSGFSMDDVKVHYNSDKPAQLNALAYAQGSDIHLGAGQEKHLAHEAWHVVQQKQGRVQPTMQMKGGVAINDNSGLESEADLMGSMAAQFKAEGAADANLNIANAYGNHVLQRMVGVTKNKITGDLIEANSIKYAKDLAGGPVGLFHELDFSQILDGGSLYIVAHGSKTESGEYSSAKILRYLLDPKTGLRVDSRNIKIVFTSCHAGEGATDPKTDSVSAEVAKGLKDAGHTNIMVFGARGLSLKSSATGDDFTVIDPAKETEYWPLQEKMLDKHKPKQTYDAWLHKNGSATLDERAEKASEISAAFYVELIYEAEQLGLTLPNQEAMSVHKITNDGKFYYKMRNMAQSPYSMDIEDYGSPWEKL